MVEIFGWGGAVTTGAALVVLRVVMGGSGCCEGRKGHAPVSLPSLSLPPANLLLFWKPRSDRAMAHFDEDGDDVDLSDEDTLEEIVAELDKPRKPGRAVKLVKPKTKKKAGGDDDDDWKRDYDLGDEDQDYLYIPNSIASPDAYIPKPKAKKGVSKPKAEVKQQKKSKKKEDGKQAKQRSKSKSRSRSRSRERERKSRSRSREREPQPAASSSNNASSSSNMGVQPSTVHVKSLSVDAQRLWDLVHKSKTDLISFVSNNSKASKNSLRDWDRERLEQVSISMLRWMDKDAPERLQKQYDKAVRERDRRNQQRKQQRSTAKKSSGEGAAGAASGRPPSPSAN